MFRESPWLQESAEAFIMNITAVEDPNATVDPAQLSYIMNFAYANRHGYQYHASNGDEFANYFNSKFPNYHKSWYKLKFVMDIQERYPNCEWIASLDENSYFWMDNHELDLESWFSVGDIHESSHAYQEFRLRNLRSEQLIPWREQPAIFMIGLSGVYSVLKIGSPHPPGSHFIDYAPSSVFFVKNNYNGRKLIYDWLFQPDDSEYTKNLYHHFANHGEREQSILNRIILPKYEYQVFYYSYLDFLAPDGERIRNVRNDMNMQVHREALTQILI
jgi:hypothetical protein